jgi:hypothetical protein
LPLKMVGWSDTSRSRRSGYLLGILQPTKQQQCCSSINEWQCDCTMTTALSSSWHTQQQWQGQLQKKQPTAKDTQNMIWLWQSGCSSHRTCID